MREIVLGCASLSLCVLSGCVADDNQVAKAQVSFLRSSNWSAVSIASGVYHTAVECEFSVLRFSVVRIGRMRGIRVLMRVVVLNEIIPARRIKVSKSIA